MNPNLAGKRFFGRNNLFQTTTSPRPSCLPSNATVSGLPHIAITLLNKGSRLCDRAVANVRSYAYLPLVLSAYAVTQHLSTIFFFVAIFVQLNSHPSEDQDHLVQWDPRILAWSAIVAYPFGFMLWEALEWRVIERDDRKKTSKSQLPRQVERHF